jgi:hypothetical protein
MYFIVTDRSLDLPTPRGSISAGVQSSGPVMDDGANRGETLWARAAFFARVRPDL